MGGGGGGGGGRPNLMLAKVQVFGPWTFWTWPGTWPETWPGPDLDLSLTINPRGLGLTLKSLGPPPYNKLGNPFTLLGHPYTWLMAGPPLHLAGPPLLQTGQTVCKLCAIVSNYLQTFWKLIANFLKIVCKLFENFLKLCGICWLAIGKLYEIS